METLIGHLRKMKSTLESPVAYAMVVGDVDIPLNDLLGKKLSLKLTGEIACVQCGAKTYKSFQQGYCFPCLRRLQECNLCIIHPERCLVESGSCPQDDWAHAQCHASQVVYLANSSGLKVGITRDTQVPTRWIDQGARQALPIFKVSNRYQAGVLEVAFKRVVADKTNWRTMLKQDVPLLDLTSERDRLFDMLDSEIEAAIQACGEDNIHTIQDEQIVQLSYPVLEYPEKIKSLSLEKTPHIEGCLMGIKGQYLLLDSGVLNVRKFSGYEIEWSVSDA